MQIRLENQYITHRISKCCPKRNKLERDLIAMLCGIFFTFKRMFRIIIFVMIQTLEAIVSETGSVRLLSEIHLKESRRALVMILEEDPKVSETEFLSEQSLATDWLRDEEDEAWSHLQLEQ